MTKGERRRARKAARAEGRRLDGDLALASDRDRGPVEFTDSRRGRDALDRWARRYYELNGAPEGPEDR